MAGVRVEVVTVPECPNGPVVEARLAEALAGRADVVVVRREVTDAAGAAQAGMHGSPTVLVDGVDPFAAAGTATSFACRLYRDGAGRMDGAPSVAELRRVLGVPAASGEPTPDAEAADCCATPAASTAASPAAAPVAGPVGRGGRGRLAPVGGGQRAVQQAVLRAFAATGRAPGPAALDAVAAPFGRTGAEVLAELGAEDFVSVDAVGRVDAAYPFSARPTGHVVDLPGGVRVSAMCAVDALGIPAMLGTDAVITSTDPVDDAGVRVTFAGGTAWWEPASAVVYAGTRAGTGPAAALCCGYLRFFGSRANAERWAAARPGVTGTVLDQADAERLGREVFGPLLTDDAGNR